MEHNYEASFSYSVQCAAHPSVKYLHLQFFDLTLTCDIMWVYEEKVAVHSFFQS